MLMLEPAGQFEHEEVVAPMMGVGPLVSNVAAPDPEISPPDTALPDTMTLPVVIAPPVVTDDAAVPIDAGPTDAIASAGAVIVVPCETAVVAVFVGASVAAVVFVKWNGAGVKLPPTKGFFPV